MENACTLIVQPLEGKVYQRDNKNFANIPIKVLYTRPVVSIRVRAESKDFSSDWVNLRLSFNNAEGNINLPGGKWYCFYTEAFNEEGGLAESGSVRKVGVGEVFITGGQSNSLNFGEKLTVEESGLVVSYDPKKDCWQSCADPQPCEPGPKVDMGEGGSIWPTLGDLLTRKLHVPIGFIATGWGGAALSEFGENTVKYNRLKNALRYTGINGVRAVLWHQGETDSVNGTTISEYETLLLNLIARSKKDAGWEVPWMVANASYHPKALREKEMAIRKAQENCCNGRTIFLGPDSDKLLEGYRILNSAHFNLDGLKEHGKLWFDSVINFIK